MQDSTTYNHNLKVRIAPLSSAGLSNETNLTSWFCSALKRGTGARSCLVWLNAYDATSFDICGPDNAEVGPSSLSTEPSRMMLCQHGAFLRARKPANDYAYPWCYDSLSGALIVCCTAVLKWGLQLVHHSLLTGGVLTTWRLRKAVPLHCWLTAIQKPVTKPWMRAYPR